MTGETRFDWWKSGIIYQIYPRSFRDTNGDGIGDLAGIESRLDYLVELGVDAVWISPFYPSPMADFGYDVADYCDVDPMFGTLADFDRLLDAVHARGLKLILDLVPGHTSDEHPWFVESRSSRTSPKRDWYVWRDPSPEDGPPNNWLSEFGGSAWTFDATAGQHYLHMFDTRQPTLNWYNPAVREAVYDVMRFWFDRGIDGFRVDAVQHMAPDPACRDNPPNPDWTSAMGPTRAVLGTYTEHQPEILKIAIEMREVARSYPEERLLIGEIYGTMEQSVAYFGPDLSGFHIPYNFQLIHAAWQPRGIAKLVEDYEAALPEGAWPNWVLDNHDRARIASRVGPEQARVAAVLLLTLRGTPTIYQGEELGMENVPIPPDRIVDPWEINIPGAGFGRDPVRTPLAWTTGPGSGFTSGEPWLPIDTRPGLSIGEQDKDPGSMLALYRQLIALRRGEPALSRGSYRTLFVDDSVYCYERRFGDSAYAVALNFTSDERPAPCPGEPVLTTGASPAPDMLAPNEARIVATA